MTTTTQEAQKNPQERQLERFDVNTRRSRAIRANGFVFLAGQVADDLTGSIEDQTREALAKVDALLAETGSSPGHIVSVTIWLRSMSDYNGFNSVWDQWVDPSNPPTRACAEVQMAMDDIRVELIVTALVAD